MKTVFYLQNSNLEFYLRRPLGQTTYGLTNVLCFFFFLSRAKFSNSTKIIIIIKCII